MEADIQCLESSHIKELIEKFDQLQTQSLDAVSLVKQLIVTSNHLAISTTLEYSEGNQADPEYIDLARQLWGLAEKCTQSSIQISILRKLILTKAKLKSLI